MAWSKIQTAANASAAAVTALSTNLAASKQGSELLVAICVIGNGVAITPPPGFVQRASAVNTNPAGATIALFAYENNPGGLTNTGNFSFASALAALVLGEYFNSTLVPIPLDNQGQSTNSNGTTAGALGSTTMAEQSELGILVIGYDGSALLTLSNITPGYNQDSATISTGAAPNAAIHLLSNLNVTNSLFGCVATLSATPTAGPSWIFISYLSFPLIGNNGGVGPKTLVETFSGGVL